VWGGHPLSFKGEIREYLSLKAGIRRSHFNCKNITWPKVIPGVIYVHSGY